MRTIHTKGSKKLSFVVKTSIPSISKSEQSSDTRKKLQKSNRHVRVVVYDLLGKTIKILTDRTWVAGTYQVTWDGVNAHGIPVSSGIYLYQITVDHRQMTKKMLVMR